MRRGGVAQVAVVAGNVPIQELVQARRDLRDVRLGALANAERKICEVGVDVRVLRPGTEGLCTLTPYLHDLIGQRADVVGGARVTDSESEPAEVVGDDVRNAVCRASDRGAVGGWRAGLAVVTATTGEQDCGE